MENIQETINRYIKICLQLYPELRYCQLVSNAAALGGWQDNDVFYCEDEMLKKGLLIMMERAGS